MAEVPAVKKAYYNSEDIKYQSLSLCLSKNNQFGHIAYFLLSFLNKQTQLNNFVIGDAMGLRST